MRTFCIELTGSQILHRRQEPDSHRTSGFDHDGGFTTVDVQDAGETELERPQTNWVLYNLEETTMKEDKEVPGRQVSMKHKTRSPHNEKDPPSRWSWGTVTQIRYQTLLSSCDRAMAMRYMTTGRRIDMIVLLRFSQSPHVSGNTFWLARQ